MRVKNFSFCRRILIGWMKLSNEDWYARRGYIVYKTVDQMWNEKDKTGKVWWTPAVFMRKEIS